MNGCGVRPAAPAFSLPAPMISSAEAPRANDHLRCAVVSRRASGVSPTGLRAATFTLLPHPNPKARV
jgi:hypothetical protein